MSDWDQSTPVDFVRGEPGRRYAELAKMPGRGQVSEGNTPTLQVPLPFRRSGYVLHVGIGNTDRRAAQLDIAVNGVHLAKHKANRKRAIDSVEVFIPGRALTVTGDSALTVRNAGGGAWLGRLLLIPYGCVRVPLQAVIPVSGFLLLLVGAIRQHWRGRTLRPAWFAAVTFFVCCHTLFTAKVVPLAGVVFSDSDELVRPFLMNAMEYDLTKHMLCLPVIHLFWRLFSLLGWMEMVALTGAFALVAALNVAVAYMVFARITRQGLGAALLTLCYAASFSIWLYSSIYETFIFSSLVTNLFLLLWLSSRASHSLGRAFLQSGLVVLCGLAHPPLLVFLGAVIHQWLRMWRERRLAVTAAGVMVLVLLTCGGFLGGRFLLRRAYIPAAAELATGSVVDEAADAGKMVDLYAGPHNMTWWNVGNMVLGQCVYAMGGHQPDYDWSGGWSAGGIYLKRPSRWSVAAGIIALWLLAFYGGVTRKKVLLESLSLVALVMLPYMLFFYWFNPREMLLYSPPMMTVMLGWQAWAGRSVSPRLFDGLVAATACVMLCVNTMAIFAFQ